MMDGLHQWLKAINGVRTVGQLLATELLSRVVFYAHELSGILLHDSVDEFLSFEKADDLLVSVQSPPWLLRVNAEF